MLSFPRAKINIGLHITSKRSDGYHNIESIFYPIQLTDVLEIVPSNGKSLIDFNATGINIPNDGNLNLIEKAYHLLNDKFNLPSVEAHLNKIIPIGAGLGGGSADGAETINLLNNLFDLKLSVEEKEDFALQLGSDCPFFIESKPKYVEGRGEVMRSINLNLSEYTIFIVNPGIHVSTKEAYAGIEPNERAFDLSSTINNIPLEEWRLHIYNDFEKSIFKKYPLIADVKQKLYDSGALYASMTGSGSTVYGIFKEKPTEIKGIEGMYNWMN